MDKGCNGVNAGNGVDSMEGASPTFAGGRHGFPFPAFPAFPALILVRYLGLGSQNIMQCHDPYRRALLVRHQN